MEFCCDQTLKITHLAWKSPVKVLEFGFDKSVGTLSNVISWGFYSCLSKNKNKKKTADDIVVPITDKALNCAVILSWPLCRFYIDTDLGKPFL